MKNLNKYTKAELISKLKNKRLEIQNSNTITEGIISKILLFKSLILKLTLITFIITWIKKYSLVRKLWHLFSMIGSTLLGFSMIDIYAFDFIDWLKDTNIYKWYSELFNNPKIESDNKPSSIMRTFDKNATRNETKDEEDFGIIRKIHKITNPEPDPVIIDKLEEDIENPPFYKNKYFIIGAASITMLVSWYYFDEIKTGYGAIIDYLSSFRSSPPDDSTGNNSNSSAISNTMTDGSKLNIKQKLDNLFKTSDRIAGDASSEIEILDNSQPIASTSKLAKVKGASLEDLNNQASESWAAPKSDSSSSTITPSKIDEITTLIEPIEQVTKTWNLMFSSNVLNKIKIIEKTLESSIELDDKRKDFLARLLGELMAEYDVQTIAFNRQIKNLTEQDIINSRPF